MTLPTVTDGDRRILAGCAFILVPIGLIAILLVLLRPLLQPLLDRPKTPPAEQPVPESPALPPESPDPSVPSVPIVPSAPEVPVVPEAPSLPPTPPPAEPPAEHPAALEAPPPPAPHLRQTRWGMAPDEVLAAESPARPVHTTPNTLTYTTTTLDLPTRLTYTFRSGRLASARLQFSLSSDGDIPSLSPAAAHAAYLWLRSQLIARYDTPASETHATRPRPTTHLADRAARSREDAETYAATLATARQRLADRTARLREKYRNWPEAAARIDRELASERRYVADLEAWVADTRAAEKTAQDAIDQSRRDDTTSPLLARDTATWHPTAVPHTVTLAADYTTLPSRLEIRYKTTLLLGNDL